MTRTSRVFRSIVTDYIKFGIGIIAGLVVMPLLIHYLGREAFGLWAIILSMMGYMGVLEFGLGPTTARHVAPYRAQGQPQAISEFVSTTLCMFVPLAAIVTVIGAIYTNALLSRTLSPRSYTQVPEPACPSICNRSCEALGHGLLSLK